jgi:hypothetical protein
MPIWSRTFRVRNENILVTTPDELKARALACMFSTALEDVSILCSHTLSQQCTCSPLESLAFPVFLRQTPLSVGSVPRFLLLLPCERSLFMSASVKVYFRCQVLQQLRDAVYVLRHPKLMTA